MTGDELPCSPRALLRLQGWLSPSFPNGAYSYSHGLEWAVEAGHIHDRSSLVDWLEADLCYGSGRNEAIFFSEAYRCVVESDQAGLSRVAELAAAFRGTSEFALESSQQATACLSTLRRVWPDRILDLFSEMSCQPVLAVVLGARSASEQIPVRMALPAFLHSYVANLA
ncbi:MAG TPA: urease accessory UreF family protein, partial [Bradyrhizobium sp.]|nr:urease accessory UreF family protein [Bradyrhizobium sp.]